jgi:hypothetical protein
MARTQPNARTNNFGVPRGTPRYPEVPRGTSRYLGVLRGTPGYSEVPRKDPMRACWGYVGAPRNTSGKFGVPRNTPRYLGVPRGTSGYPGVPRGTSGYLGFLLHRKQGPLQGSSGPQSVSYGRCRMGPALSRQYCKASQDNEASKDNQAANNCMFSKTSHKGAQYTKTTKIMYKVCMARACFRIRAASVQQAEVVHNVCVPSDQRCKHTK